MSVIFQCLDFKLFIYYASFCFSLFQIVGCFCLTEIGHGSNSKFMQTTATYDKATKEFVLNTPNFEAAKCWAGLLGNDFTLMIQAYAVITKINNILGQSATHAIVFAQLITPDGVRHGLHAFIIPIRDPKTHLPYPGIIVGDMGEKIGLNGVDNG